MSVCMYVCVCVFVCVSVYMYVCVSVYVCVCVSVQCGCMASNERGCRCVRRSVHRTSHTHIVLLCCCSVFLLLLLFQRFVLLGDPNLEYLLSALNLALFSFSFSFCFYLFLLLFRFREVEKSSAQHPLRPLSDQPNAVLSAKLNDAERVANTLRRK